MSEIEAIRKLSAVGTQPDSRRARRFPWRTRIGGVKIVPIERPQTLGNESVDAADHRVRTPTPKMASAALLNRLILWSSPTETMTFNKFP